MAWQPLFDGPFADYARRMARELALAAAAAGAPASPVDRTLFWAYASLALDEPFARAHYDRALDDLVAQLLAGVRHPMLYNDGLAGIGWVLAHVLDGDGDGILPMVDRTMLHVVSAEPWRGDYDLSQGLVGHGLYFLERLRGRTASDAPLAAEGLARVVAQLAACAERTADGACWHTAAEHLPDSHRARFPRGRYDCGLAHGVAGVIALLERAADQPGAAALRDDATRWLLAQRGGVNTVGGRFPAFARTGEAFEPSRAAWCYGDLGVAVALWSVAPELALETAHDCAARGPLRCHVVDPALCHGSAGLAHLYNRFYQATGDHRFAAPARGWFAATIEATALWNAPEYRVVDGKLGIALALLAAVTPIEPAWDRMMLCDVSPPAACNTPPRCVSSST